MTKRYTLSPAGSGWWDVYDESRGHYMAMARERKDAEEILAALNLHARLVEFVWGAEGCPSWLEGEDR
jgi:hypothetical protein